MKKLLSISSALFFILLFGFAGFSQTNTVNYEESFIDFPNPERGFYRYSSTYASPYSFLKESDLRSYRKLHSPWSADYDIYSTLVFRYIFLKDFVDSPITPEFLENMEKDFETLRRGGAKLILRFAYTESVNSDGCSSWICPPYGDASKERVLEHISQLKPLLQANKDVIAVVQFGFIGVWGEGYYTDYFGDASLSPHHLTEENWNDRNEVLTALLDALPEDRQVQVRYPQIKQKNLYGPFAPTTSDPLNREEAHNGTALARIGHHNDCFLASSTDFGTYQDYGPPSSKSDSVTLKPYLAEDSRFLAVGGETCSTYNPHDNCASAGGRADTEMRRFHYSYLNSQYNNSKVNNEWVDQGCIEEIKRELGYRFVLIQGSYPSSAKQGDKHNFSIQLKNVGYAPPFNPRDVELILRNEEQNVSYRLKLDEDPRFWESGEMINVSVDACLPVDILPGNYELFLNLPDPEPTLHDNKDFAIRLANKNVWTYNLGYNKLFRVLEISEKTDANPCQGGPEFEPFDHVSGTDNILKDQGYKFYPNPATRKINIEAENSFNYDNSFSIYSSYGQLVKNGSFSPQSNYASVNIEFLPAGSYTFRMMENKKVHVEHLIILD